MKITQTQIQIHRKILRRILLVAVERLTPTQRRGVESYLGACKLARSKRCERTDDELLVKALSLYLPDSPPLRALNRNLKGNYRLRGKIPIHRSR
jgi:predicted GNAT family N-acyltransferase